MGPETAERLTSASSVYRSTRQRLQDPANRRVYAVENGLGTVESNSTLDASNLLNNPATGSTHLLQTNDPKLQNVVTTSLKHLMFQKMNQKTMEVHIRCLFLRVGGIDTLNERYYAEILLEASWEDTSLKSIPNQTFDPAIHWTPELELMNGIGDLKDEITYSIRYNKQGLTTITEHHKLKGTLWERMELYHFPLDIQSLSITITTSRTNTEMMFIENLRKPSGVNRQVFTDEQAWDLFEHVDIVLSEQSDEYTDHGHKHPVISCSCYAARKYGYYMWNAYFLIFLITSASFTTFPIPLANIQGRIQISCTLLLTSITFRWLCNKALPTISYLTAVDIYATGSIFSLCLLNIFHGVIGYVNYYISTNLQYASSTTTSVSYIIIIDRWALVVFTILFFGYQIGTIIWMCLVPGKKRRMLRRKDEQNRLRNALNNNPAKAAALINVSTRAKKY